jgi:hypothetical protein
LVPLPQLPRKLLCEVLGARVGLLNDSRAIGYIIIVDVDDGHSALEILRAN